MKGARVLVVDDHRDMADGIAMLLEEQSVRVRVAYSAREASALLEKERCDLVLTDVRMPSVDGMQLLGEIRERWPRTKVVLLTAHGSIDSAVEAMKRGACDYLTKPFDNEELVAVVRRAVEGRPRSDGSEIPTAVGDVAAVVSPDDLLPSLRDALDVLLRATGADDGEIFLCEPEGRDPLLSVWAGPDGRALADRTRFQLNVGYPGIVVATGEPLLMKGGMADDRRYLRRAVTEIGISSCVCVPLPTPRGPLGSLHLLSRRDDFPVERVAELLGRAAVPIGNAVRAGLAALRQSVDLTCAEAGASGQWLRALLGCILEAAGSRHGTLALIDPQTGQPDRVVSVDPASLICALAEAGGWAECPSILAGHGFAADRGRRRWPLSCRRGLPRRMASPCCLPLAADGRLHGIVVLDFGRLGDDHAISRLVPLLTMAEQAAIRLQSHQAGLALDDVRGGRTAGGPSEHVPELELRCLGPFTVRRHGKPVPVEAFPRSKALTLLKVLALKAGAPIARDAVIELLWPGVEPRSGANRLHGVVHALRSVIEPYRAERRWLFVRNRGELYYLDTDAPVEVDLVDFQLLVARGMRSKGDDPGKAIAYLAEAVELYRGPLFEDDPYADWCEDERRELHDLHLSALEQLAVLHESAGDPGKAVEALRRALRSERLREDLHQALIELLARIGRRTEALAHCDEYQRLVESELGVEPSREVRALRGRLARAQRAVNPG